MSWCKLMDTFARHPKVLALARTLSIGRVQAAGHVSIFWSWATVNAKDSLLTHFEEADLEAAALWEGERGKFVQACVSVGFFDLRRGVLKIHDWGEHFGAGKDVDRQRKHRSKPVSLSRDMSRDPSRDMSRLEEKREEERRREEIRKEEEKKEEEESSHRTQQQPAASSAPPAPTASPALALQLVDPEPPKPKPAEAVAQVFTRYRHYHPRAKLNDKDRRAIEARMRDGFTAEDLVQAIDGCHMDPWHLGENDRGRPYTSLELITRDAGHVTDFIELFEHGGTRKPVPRNESQNARNIRLGLESLAQLEQQDVGARMRADAQAQQRAQMQRAVGDLCDVRYLPERAT